MSRPQSHCASAPVLRDRPSLPSEGLAVRQSRVTIQVNLTSGHSQGNGLRCKNATISLHGRYSVYYAGSRNAGFMPCGNGMRNVLSIIETRA
jgi:hypothetical protein